MIMFCLCLVLTIVLSVAFRSLPVNPYRIVQKRLQSTKTDDSVESNAVRITKAPIYAIPRSLVSSEAVVRYLQKWATESTISTGTAISFQQKFNGVRFLFTPAPLSYLDFDVTHADLNNNEETSNSVVSEQEMLLEMAFAAHEKDSVQAQSLVKLAAQNLYESLVNDIGALIMNVKDEPGDYSLSSLRLYSHTNIHPLPNSHLLFAHVWFDDPQILLPHQSRYRKCVMKAVVMLVVVQWIGCKRRY